MSKRVRVITSSALLISLTMVFLYLSTVLPNVQLGLVAAASLFVAAQVIETNLMGGLYVFIGSCILGFLIVPDKTSLILYSLFFGYYPLVKSLAERPKKAVLRWGIKLVVMNTALAVILGFFGELIFDLSQFEYGIWIVAVIINLVFILFDIGVSKLIGLYMGRIHRKR